MHVCSNVVVRHFDSFITYRLIIGYLGVASVGVRDIHMVTHSVSTLPAE